MDLGLFPPPLVACLVIVAVHSYLGLHVLAREVIFVDLSLAQMAALGAALFALTRTEGHGRVPQKAIKDILVGSLLWVTWPVIGRLAPAYLARSALGGREKVAVPDTAPGITA